MSVLPAPRPRVLRRPVLLGVLIAFADIVPGRLVVDAGTHLVLDVVNKDSEVHDLAVHSGPRTAMLRAGQSQRLDVGVVTRDLDAWCTVGQHKLLGMTLDIRVAGGAG